LPDFYNKAIHGIEIGAGVGSCGTAAFTGERVVVEDIQTHPYWAPYKVLAAKAGLRSCWSEPIHSSHGKVVGTFAIYHSDIHSPNEDNLALIEETANLASIAIEKYLVESQLEQGKFLRDQALNLAQAGHWSIDFSEGDQYYISSERTVEIFGDPHRNGFRYHILNDWYVNLEAADKKLADATLANYLAAVDGTVPRYDMIHPYKRPCDGRIVWVHVLGHVVRDHQGKPTHVYGVVMDVTQQILFEKELECQAHIDYLTGLSNRGHFMHEAERELARAIRYENDLSILMMDIDRFKQINDKHGHKAGDLVLQKLAEVCRVTLREVDIIGRIGGEEFALLLPETSKPVAAEVAERLREGIASTKVPMESGPPISFTVSIGISSLTSPDNNLEILLSSADKGLYEAKNSGRNRVSIVDQ
jgi:diguanylate cyclase (GGDEF)-like protein